MGIFEERRSTSRGQRSVDGPNPTSVSALLLALVAVTLISAVPARQFSADLAVEVDFGESGDLFADGPPTALAFTDEQPPAADSELSAAPLPLFDFPAGYNLRGEAAGELPEFQPVTTELPREDDRGAATTANVPGGTVPVSEVPGSKVPGSNVPGSQPSTTEPTPGTTTNRGVDTQPSTTSPPRDERPASTTTTDTQPPTTSPPAPASTTTAAPAPSTQNVKLPIYDTAWELFYGLPLSDVDEYFSYLKAKGYTGLWASVLPIGYQNGGETANSALHAKNVVGQSVAELSGGNVVLTTAHANHIKAYLDKAHQHGLELNPVIAWANNNTGPSSSGNCAAHSWGPARYPTISEGNAFAYGQSVANAFGTHPAIGYWVLGGDDIWSCDSAAVWANMRNGLRTGDLGQPTTYHTGGDYNKYRDEPWNDFLSAQTGWGNNTAQLGNLKAATGKVTYAAEMRYYLDTGFTAEQVRAETQVALDQGVDAMLYGDVRRAHIGMRDNLYKKNDVPAINHIRDTFNSPGEDAFFSVVGS